MSLSGTYGHSFCRYVKWEYPPAGLSDLVVYFLRRIFSLIRPGGFTAFITTNSIKDGDIRKDGLDVIQIEGGHINFATRGIRWPGRANLVVSQLAIRNGAWTGKRILDGTEAEFINSFLEDSGAMSDPSALKENSEALFAGYDILGEGFVLSHAEGKQLILSEPLNRDVVLPVFNGQELNNEPKQEASRFVINFWDWPLERARSYVQPFELVEARVKPFRETQKRAANREYWWQYNESRVGLRRNLASRRHCFAAAATTKHLNFSAMPVDYVFTHAIKVFATDRWDLYAVVQSTLHEVWARKYSGALKQDLRYSPSKCFETFAFPDGLWQTASPSLAASGERYHEHRKSLMSSLWLGLTDIYNLFHARDLTSSKVAKVSKKSAEEAARGYEGLLELRRLHVELDVAIRDAYGWQNLSLDHDFYEVETLAENDRVRYTISPAARREVLRRLLALNHERAAAEAASSPKKSTKRAAREKVDGPTMLDMFSTE